MYIYLIWKHPVLEKIASEFIAQGELVNEVNGIKEIGKGIDYACEKIIELADSLVTNLTVVNQSQCAA